MFRMKYCGHKSPRRREIPKNVNRSSRKITDGWSDCSASGRRRCLAEMKERHYRWTIISWGKMALQSSGMAGWQTAEQILGSTPKFAERDSQIYDLVVSCQGYFMTFGYSTHQLLPPHSESTRLDVYIPFQRGQNKHGLLSGQYRSSKRCPLWCLTAAFR